MVSLTWYKCMLPVDELKFTETCDALWGCHILLNGIHGMDCLFGVGTIIWTFLIVVHYWTVSFA